MKWELSLGLRSNSIGNPGFATQSPICGNSANAIVGLRPIVFGPGTLPRHAGAGWRTWGARPIPSDLAMTLQAH